MVFTNGMWLWEVHLFQAVIFVPNSESGCNEDCSITNVTVTGGVLLTDTMTPPQIPPRGALVVFDFLILQTPGATNASVSVDSPCVTLGSSIDFPELIHLMIDISRGLSSDVRLCWNSRTNSSYQVLSSPDLNTESWDNVGDPVSGTGTTNCVTTPAGVSNRFYRVSVAP
jgi:hypothetical protein